MLWEAGEGDGPVPFPERVLELVRRLIPCDVVAFHEQPVAEPAIAHAGEPLGDFTTEMREAQALYWAQDRLAPVHGARKISDYLSLREFQAVELYREVARHIRVNYMMRLWLDPRASAARAWSSTGSSGTSVSETAPCSTSCCRT